MVVFSCYVPPSIGGKDYTLIMETLTDAITEAKTVANSPWLVVGGDFNQYDTSYVKQMIPDLEKVQTGPTRGEATLDYTFTNFPP